MKKIIILLIGIVLAFNAMSCRVDNDDLIEKIIILENIKSSENTEKKEENPKLDEPSETEEGEEIEKPKDEDDVDESKDDSEKKDEENNTVVENKTWCEISEDTNILELNYFVCVDGSQTKLNPESRFESEAKRDGFIVTGCAPKYVQISVRYDNEKLNFSSGGDTYTIIDVVRNGSDINITIEWK